MTRGVVLAVLVAGLAVAAAPAGALPPGGMTAAQVAAMFGGYGDAGGHWTGGDSTVSVPLPDGRVAWLFSDTFLGTVNADGSRPANTPLVNNTIVVQDSGTNLVSTLHGGTAAAPDALVKPSQAGEFFWVADGMVEGGALKVLYNRYRRTGSGSLDVALTGTALATFALPGLTLSTVVDLPLGNAVAWGSAILTDSAHTYIYGSSVPATDEPRFAHLARAPAGNLGGAWQYWSGSTWSSDPSAAGRLLSGVGTAYAVQKVGSEYVLVTQEGNLIFNPQVVAYTASSPTGPFGGPVQLLTAPEPTPGSPIIVYDVRLHPELATSGKLLVSYNVNSLDNDDNFADARLYRPRFADLAWPQPSPGPGAPQTAPAGVTVTVDGAGIAALSWQAVSGATSYRVYQRDLTVGQTHSARLPNVVTATSTDVGLLLSGHTYEFRVAAANAAGEGPLSTVVSTTPNILPPPAPTGLSATANTAGQITVGWSAVSNAWGYEVFRRDVTAGDAEFVSIGRPDGQQTTHVTEGLAHGHEYEFRVTAQHGGGTSTPSANARATATYAVPGAPTALTATANSDGTIRLAWTAPGTDLWYLVFQRDVTANEASFTQLPLPVTACCTMTAGYLFHDHEYEFKVTATSPGGQGPPSNLARARSLYPVPAPPTNLTVSPGDGQVTLSWTTSSTPNVWYLVYQRNVTRNEQQFTQLPYPVTTCCTMTPGYLTNGETYEFKVTTIGQGGESAPSNTVQVTPRPPAPGQVTGLTATARGDGTIRLTWTAPGPGGYYYWIESRKVSAGEQNFTRGPWPTDQTTYTTDPLLKNDVYDFRIIANNLGGDGPTSNVVQATVRYDPPPAPANLRGVAAGDGHIDLTWDAPGPGGYYYWIESRHVSGGQQGFIRGPLPTDQTYHRAGPLVHGDLYEFRVVANNQGGDGPPTAPVQVRALGGLPQPPSTLTAAPGDKQATLRWTASPTPNVTYNIYQRLTPNGSWTKLPLPVSGTTMTAGFLTNGQTYEFKVSASNASGESAASNVVSAKPMPPVPQPPTNLTATAGNGTVTLHWTASITPSVYYWIELRSGGGSWSRLQYPLSTCCSFEVSYLTNGTTYEFRLRANNLAGDSTPSNVVAARPLPPFPQSPTGLTATAGDGRVTLRWTASPTSGVWYLVEIRPAGTTGWQRLQFPLTTCCTHDVSLLLNGTTYEFRLLSTNAAGVSTPSNVASARPMPPLPPTPTNLRAQVGNRTVILDWDPSPIPVFYWVWMDDGSGRFTRLGLPTNWHHAELIVSRGNRTYRFTVQANNLAGDSGFSNVVIATPWEPTFSWAPYFPRREFVWIRTTDWSYEGATISSDCDTVPGNPYDPVCHRWIQFQSRGGEYFWYVDIHGVRHQIYAASAFWYREKYCRGLFCVGPTGWRWNSFPPCHTGGPYYGYVYACSPYFGWRYLYSTSISPSLPI